MDKNFVIRLISGIALIALLVLFFFLGGRYLICFVEALSLVGCYELLRVFKLEKKALGVICYGSVIMYYSMMLLRTGIRWDVAGAYFTFIYVGVMLSYIPLTGNLFGGAWLLWLIIIGSWGSDTCAYVVGKLCGKHHFSALSPKKTVEGCIGGIVGSALIALIYSYFFPVQIRYIINVHILFPLVACVCAFISMIGDLSASAIKRNYDIKDYGRLIPGHGGVLDRFDSVIFVAPVIYYFIIFVQR